MKNETVKSDHGAKKSIECMLFALYTVLIIAIYTLPITKFLFPYIPVAIAMLVSLPLLLMYGRKYINYSIIILSVSAFLIMFIYIAGASPSDAINEGIRNLRFFIPVMWGMFAVEYCSRKNCGWILLIIGILLAYIFINTLIELEINPWIARELAQGKGTSSAQINAFRMRNIGGFEFSYMMGIITLCFVWTALSAKNTLLKIAFSVCAIVCFYYIIQSMYTTLLILTFIGTCILLLMKVKNPLIKLSIIFVGLLLIVFIADIFKIVGQMFPEESLLNEKFTNMYKSIVNDDLSEVGSRPELIIDSLGRWIKNPMFGKISAESNAHSMMISMLENTGAFGFSMWISLFVYSFLILKKQLNKYGFETKLFSVAFAYVLVLSFFNPIGYVFEVTIAAFFIVPIWQKVISKI